MIQNLDDTESSPKSSVGYASDIRPLFRERDIASMQRAGAFDLSVYEDVAARASGILARLEAGNMPCDGAWPPDRVALFARWIEEGCQP